MCGLEDVMRTQEQTEVLANYQYVCFGNWTGTITTEDATSGKNWDGTIFEYAGRGR